MDEKRAAPEVVKVESWPSELPLFVLLVLAALAAWILIVFSIFGLFYAVLIGLFVFISHLAFVTHIRGSGVKLGPDQFPALHQRVRELSARAGIEPPAAYILQQGGALNALATKFLRSRMIVLYSDLLEACEGDNGARDMVIGHEIGHIRAGHLNWLWILAPGYFVPFLGSAYSRARERTCDRYGVALSGDRDGALRGLAILAAGGSHGPQVNLEAMVRQREDVAGGWMTLGRWLSPYPTLAERIEAVKPALGGGGSPGRRGPVLACGLMLLIFGLPVAGVLGLVSAVAIPTFKAAVDQALSLGEGEYDDYYEDESFPVELTAEEIEAATEEVFKGVEGLADAVRRFEGQNGALPEDADVVYDLWPTWYPDRPEPLDPFDGYRYGYGLTESGFLIWSSGPDQRGGTEDDLSFEFDRASPSAE